MQSRLHLILGNHDVQGNRRDRVEKDGIVAREGLILRHARTGQRVFVVHGHQADLMSDQFNIMGRFLVRYIWKYFKFLGFGKATGRAQDIQKLLALGPKGILGWLRSQETKIEQRLIERSNGTVEQRIIEWLQSHWHVTICGHTHRPMCAGYGAPPYFNAGSCVYPGYLTGLEIQDGEIMLVKWSARSETRPGGEMLITERELMEAPRKLRLFG